MAASAANSTQRGKSTPPGQFKSSTARRFPNVSAACRRPPPAPSPGRPTALPAEEQRGPADDSSAFFHRVFVFPQVSLYASCDVAIRSHVMMATVVADLLHQRLRWSCPVHIAATRLLSCIRPTVRSWIRIFWRWRYRPRLVRHVRRLRRSSEEAAPIHRMMEDGLSHPRWSYESWANRWGLNSSWVWNRCHVSHEALNSFDPHLNFDVLRHWCNIDVSYGYHNS